MKATHLDPAGVIATLFDFSFTEFLTLKVVRLVYAVAVLGGGLAAAGIGLVGFGRSVLTGLWTLLLATFLYLLGLVITRMWLEAAVVFFRLADSAAEVGEQAAQIALNTRTPKAANSPVSPGAMI